MSALLNHHFDQSSASFISNHENTPYEVNTKVISQHKVHMLSSVSKNQSCHMNQQSSLFTTLPLEILLEHILPFIPQRNELIAISAVCKKFRTILHSNEAAKLWDESYEQCFQVCVDGYCPICHFNKMSGSLECATRFLSKCPIRRLQVHSFIIDIPRILNALSIKGTLRQLSLSLTYQQNSKTLNEVLTDGMNSSILLKQRNGFNELSELILDSSHLNYVQLEGRAALLDYLGSNLESLSFRNLSPSNVFTILEKRCPKLKHLRVDRALTSIDLNSYKNIYLEELELKRCTFIIYEPLILLPSLKKLRFSTSFRMEPIQVKSLIASIPKFLISLSIEVPSSLANQLLVLISRHLTLLEDFTLEGAFESSKISPRAVYFLAIRCTLLKSIQIRHAKSVNALSFQSIECINMLIQYCPNLTLLRMRYDVIFLPILYHLLTNSLNMKQLILWQRKRWMKVDVWDEMELNLKKLQNAFPSVKIDLEDI